MLVGLAPVFFTAVAGASTPVVTISPGPSGNRFSDDQSVTVSVGANSVFSPNQRVEIVECADPGGTAGNLPTNFSSCDGGTHQGDSVIVQSDGSLSESGYVMDAVPNARLGERSTWSPVCNKTNYCVLYVGQDYNDFSQPKLFSAPFLYTSDPAAVTSPAGTPATGSGTPTAPSASAKANPAVSVQSGASAVTAAGSGSGTGSSTAVSSGTLAFTGLPPDTTVLLALGLGFAGLGMAGRRLARRQVQ